MNHQSPQEIRVQKSILTLVLFGSTIVFATAFWAAWYTQTYFMLKLFTFEVILAAIIILVVMRKK